MTIEVWRIPPTASALDSHHIHSDAEFVGRRALGRGTPLGGREGSCADPPPTVPSHRSSSITSGAPPVDPTTGAQQELAHGASRVCARHRSGMTGQMPHIDGGGAAGPRRLFASANQELADAGWRRRFRLAEQEARRKARRVERQVRLHQAQAGSRRREAVRKRYLDAAQARRRAQHDRMLRIRRSRWPGTH
jgi:hypothetical protein